MAWVEIVKEILQSPLIVGLLVFWATWWTSRYSQRNEHRRDLIDREFEALAEYMHVAQNVPCDLQFPEFLDLLNTNKEYRDQLKHRIVRLLGLRVERAATLDRELISYIDQKFRPLFKERNGVCEIIPEKMPDFPYVVYELPALGRKVEDRLVREYKRLNK